MAVQPDVQFRIQCQQCILCDPSLDILLELSHNGLHTSLVYDEPKAERVGIVKPSRPRQNEAAADGIVLELDEIQRLPTADLLERAQFVAHRRGKSREADDAGV